MKSVELIDVKKTYFIENPKTGEVRAHLALNGVSVAFSEGEIHSLLGENGAGKSTLVHILSAQEAPSSGKIKIDGKVCTFYKPKDAIKAGVAIILQSLPLCLEASVLENLMIENDCFNLFFHKEKMIQKVTKRLNEWGIPKIDFNKKISSLSKEEQFFFELASRTLKNPRVLILDESTAFVSPSLRESFFSHLKKYAQEEKIVVIVITHDIDEAIKISDKVTVIRKNEAEKTLNIAQLKKTKTSFELTKDIEDLMLKKGEDEILSANVENITTEKKSSALVKNELSVNLVSKNEEFKPFSMEIKKGEIAGLIFVNACYLKLLENLLSGMDRFSLANITGGIKLMGDTDIFIPFEDITPHSLLKHKISFIPSDRYYRGSNPLLSISDVLSVYFIKDFFINTKERDRYVSSILNEEGIDSKGSDLCNSLSGGQLQRIILRRALKMEPNIIILSEPFHGLDIKSMKKLAGNLLTLAKKDKTILILTKEESNEVYSTLFNTTHLFSN